MLGSNIAIMRDDKILLTKREDFEVWCLPGGHNDPGESLAQTAIREVREETGLEVRLTHLIGLYSRPGWKNGAYHIAYFAAEVIGGEMKPQVNEVLELRFFSPEEMPWDAMLVGHADRVRDALAGASGLAVTEGARWPFSDDVDRWQVYAMRDESGLGRRAYYQQHFSDDGRVVDIGGHLKS